MEVPSKLFIKAVPQARSAVCRGIRMKNKKAAGWLICFAMVLLAPRMAWMAAGDRFAAEATENTVMAEAPRLSRENYLSFAQSLEQYYNSNVPFRSQLIAFSSLMDINLFKEKKINDQVVLGDNNWLFYCAESNIEDYKGTNLFTQEELSAIADNLLTSKEFLEKRGIEFILFLAPNKETLYGEENLPSYYKKGELTRIDQLVQYLKENTDIRVVYPIEELEAYKDDLYLYWHYDTHWNRAGGYIGGRALLAELGIEAPALEEISVLENDTSEYDLARMMNLKDYYKEKLPPDVDYAVYGYPENNLQAISLDDATARVYRSDAPDERRMFMVRDSFAGSMAGVLGSSLRECYMAHWNGFFQQSMVDEQDPDILVLEVVERRLDYLFAFRLSD